MLRSMGLALSLSMVASNINFFVKFTLNTPKWKYFRLYLISKLVFGHV